MFDYIVVGSGIAGLYTALLAADHGDVLVVTKAALEESNTRYAQGGIAAAVAPGDSPALHYEDTLRAGAGLCDEAAVRVLTEEAPSRIADLLRVGVPFDRQGGALALGLEAAHRLPRVLHAGGDATGRHIEQTLCRALREAGVTILEAAFVTQLTVEHGRVVGVEVLVADRPRLYRGRHVILASGGAGQVFSHTTNPSVATGDGLALAFRAGATLADLEFYQFHPTALRVPGAPTFLISEAVRGEGALLRDAAGRRFMPRYDERAELAPRDVVARAIAGEMAIAGADSVFLDLRHLPAQQVRERFPTIAAHCKRLGLDIATDLLPVAPAAHYFMGGVRTNLWGETTVPGLYACGEVAATGVHGANRLASNSLLEGIVFGARIVGRTLEDSDRDADAKRTPVPGLEPDLELQPAPPAPGLPNAAPPAIEQLRGTMWEQVGLVRDAGRLEQAVRRLSGWLGALRPARTVAEHERNNQVLIGWLMATAALRRDESRGAHFRSDAPATDPAWRRRITLRQGASGAAGVTYLQAREAEAYDLSIG